MYSKNVNGCRIHIMVVKKIKWVASIYGRQKLLILYNFGLLNRIGFPFILLAITWGIFYFLVKITNTVLFGFTSNHSLVHLFTPVWFLFSVSIQIGFYVVSVIGKTKMCCGSSINCTCCLNGIIKCIYVYLNSGCKMNT